MVARVITLVLMFCFLQGASVVPLMTVPVSAQDVVLQSTGQLVSCRKDSITVLMDSDGKEKVYALTADTEFFDSEGKAIAADGLKPGDRLTITTAIDSNAALTVKKGYITISF